MRPDLHVRDSACANYSRRRGLNLSGSRRTHGACKSQTAAGMSFYERCVRGALRAYKLTLSPLIGRQCRFAPTCSEYAADVLIGHGPWRGSVLTVKRLCRCHPWGGAGWDPPPPPRRNVEPEGPTKARDWKCET